MKFWDLEDDEERHRPAAGASASVERCPAPEIVTSSGVAWTAVHVDVSATPRCGRLGQLDFVFGERDAPLPTQRSPFRPTPHR